MRLVLCGGCGKMRQPSGVGDMQVVALMNMKGGVGKTTLAIYLSHSLAAFHGKKVLLVDVDPQFNATQSLVGNSIYLTHLQADKPTILDIFLPQRPGAVRTVSGHSPVRGGLALQDCLLNVMFDPTTGGRLDIIPSHLNLLEVQNSERQTEVLLQRFLEQRASGYDFVFLDCPPTISVFTQAAFLASHKYLVPLKPDPLSVIGLPLLEKWLADYSYITTRTVEKVGLVFTMVRNPQPKQMQAVIEDIRKTRGAEVFAGVLSLADAVASSVAPKKPVTIRQPTSKSSLEVKAIAEEFLLRVGA